jgi:hypothetical protein
MKIHKEFDLEEMEVYLTTKAIGMMESNDPYMRLGGRLLRDASIPFYRTFAVEKMRCKTKDDADMLISGSVETVASMIGTVIGNLAVPDDYKLLQSQIMPQLDKKVTEIMLASAEAEAKTKGRRKMP